MVKIKGFLEFEKILPLHIEKNENPKFKASKILDDLIEEDKKNKSYLSTFEIYEKELEELEEEELVFQLVKKAIDSFDPYFVHPDSYDEYDGESQRIGEIIERGMSINEIAEIMKEEFNWSFSGEFTMEDFLYPAKTVFNFLEDSLIEPGEISVKGTKKVYIYIKLHLHKLVPLKTLEEDNEEKLKKMFFNKIEANKDSEKLFSSFKTVYFWASEDIDL